MKLKTPLYILTLLCCTNLLAQSKVGTVDSEYILSKMPQLQQVQERLQRYATRLDSTFNLKVKEYQAKVSDFQNNEATLSEEVKKSKIDSLAVIEQDLNKFRSNGSQMMQLNRNEYLRPLYAKITETISEIAKEKGYTQILTTTGNELAYIDPAYDITKLVMQKMGLPTE